MKTKKIICLMMVGHVVASFVTFILSQGWRRADIVGLICAGVSLCLLAEELTVVVRTPSFGLTATKVARFVPP